MPTFDLYDWLVLVAYFLAIAGIAVWVIRQRNRSSADYFLAGAAIVVPIFIVARLFKLGGRRRQE